MNHSTTRIRTSPLDSSSGSRCTMSRSIKVAGQDYAYPEPSKPSTSVVMQGNHRRDTRPEVQVRSELHRRGYRFRKDFLIATSDVRVRPDIVFTRWKLAVFLDGCFWHQCPEHGNLPRTNSEYWIAKLGRNVQRDRNVDASLGASGWVVLRIWEHETPVTAAEQIAAALGSLRNVSSLE